MPYERSVGTALATVQNWCRHLTASGTFSTATAPTLEQVNDWLAFGQADVMALLVRYGYGTAVPANQHGLAWLEKMNALRSCMNVEMTYPVTEFGEPNPRMKMFQNQWDEGVMLIESGQLVHIGIAGSAQSSLSSNLVFTGTSRSRKLDREGETNRVAGKFPRGFGQSPRAPAVNRTITSEADDTNA